MGLALTEADAVDAGVVLGGTGRQPAARGLLRRLPRGGRHGDWIKVTSRGSCVVSGRSDSTLNRRGVRRGTADFHAVVEGFDEVADSSVIDTRLGGRGRAVCRPPMRSIPAGVELDEGLGAIPDSRRVAAGDAGLPRSGVLVVQLQVGLLQVRCAAPPSAVSSSTITHPRSPMNKPGSRVWREAVRPEATAAAGAAVEGEARSPSLPQSGVLGLGLSPSGRGRRPGAGPARGFRRGPAPSCRRSGSARAGSGCAG